MQQYTADVDRSRQVAPHGTGYGEKYLGDFFGRKVPSGMGENVRSNGGGVVGGGVEVDEGEGVGGQGAFGPRRRLSERECGGVGGCVRCVSVLAGR